MRHAMASLVLMGCVLNCAGAGEHAGPSPRVLAYSEVAELPDPLLFENGERVTSPAEWERRREEIVNLLLGIEYGTLPPAPESMEAFFLKSLVTVGDGAARKMEGTLRLGPPANLEVRIGYYVPTQGPGPFPVILALEPVWQPDLEPIAVLCARRGYIFAGYDRHDLDADNADRAGGVHPRYPDYTWGTLGAWAWGAMRMADFLATVPEADAARIAVWGHSRAGKTALLAGALDTRFALVAPHGSGAGGAGCWRVQPRGVETLELITLPERFEYWFTAGFREFAGHEQRLPFDQHFVKALVAPRVLVSFDGLEDRWANPQGTQATWQAAQPVFDLLGAPANNALYFRPGGHDTTTEDWEALLDYADHYFRGKPLGRPVSNPPFPL